MNPTHEQIAAIPPPAETTEDIKHRIERKLLALIDQSERTELSQALLNYSQWRQSVNWTGGV